MAPEHPHSGAGLGFAQMALGVALKRNSANGSELSAVAIRAVLLADVLANLLQCKPDRRNSIAPGPEMLARRNSVPRRTAGAIAIALFPLRNPITEATGCFGGMAMHMCMWSGVRCPSRIRHSFCRASHGISDQVDDVSPEDRFPPSFGNEHHIKALEEDSIPGTVKPVPVSLVEPVAYQFQLE